MTTGERDHQQAHSPSSLMFTLSLSISILSLLISSATTTDTPPPYIHTDYFLLNCGSSSNTTSQDGRNWDSDTISKFSPSNLQNASSSSHASEQNPSVSDAVPYMTARIIRSPLTYSFPVLSGPKFVRLYFYPATYSTFNISTSFFSVTANTYILLSNFSAFLTVAAASDSKPTIVKEFVINVLENQRLNITFSPDSPSSYAFVNGIEIVSMPDPLYQTHGGDDLPKFVASNGYIISNFPVDNNTALENIYRLNVGGSFISLKGDTGMYRIWSQDDEYLYVKQSGLIASSLELTINYTDKTPRYVAPEVVYQTSRTIGNTQGPNLNSNLTWIFPVDSGFNYLLRLHFCEILQEVTQKNQRVFFIYINNQTAEMDADVINWSGGRGFPVFRDYVVNVPDRDGRQRSKQDLWLAMYPSMESNPEFADGILNGLEIFKLNQSDGSLAGSNPDPTMNPSSPEKPVFPGKSERKGSFPAIPVGGVIGGFVVVLIFVCALVYQRRRGVKNAASGGSEAKTSWVPFSYTSKSTRASKTSTSSALPSDLCRHFLISEIRSATANFHDNFVIGSGGFGNVYKGYVDNGSTSVAIKRLNPSSKQGVHEFETEIKMLSKLRHLHLVSLIGYSDDDGEMILVYDYMANGTLREHLYKTKNPPLSWKKRLQICIGAARGLHYLHTGAKHTIIHRDVKSTNILLDEKWIAKVSDFGLSKMGPTDVSRTHVSTMVKGSFGYVDPEYFRRQQLTEKSDVYSFGVVLFEVLCARPAVIQGGIPKEQVSLAEWGRNCYRRGILDQIVDKNLRGQIAPECLKKFGEIANSCVLDQGIERPTMGDVVWNLEFALQLQETAERVKGEDGAIGLDQMRVASPSTPSGDSTTTDGDDVFSASGGHVSNPKSSDTLLNKSDGKSGTTTSLDQLVGNECVFSEINNPEGR